MNDKKTFRCTINWVEKEFEILYTFKSVITKKDYIVYTDNSVDDDNKLNIFAAIYYPEDDNKELENITSDEDWKVVEEFLDSVDGDKNE